MELRNNNVLLTSSEQQALGLEEDQIAATAIFAAWHAALTATKGDLETCEQSMAPPDVMLTPGGRSLTTVQRIMNF